VIGYLLLTPAGILVFGLIAYPLVYDVALSLTDATGFDGLPMDVEEHAALDGSRVDVFRHIVLPMSWPVIIAAGIFSVGVMASDFVYAGLLLVHNDVKTIAVGLGLIGISLDEFDSISGGIGMAAAPLIVICAALAPASSAHPSVVRPARRSRNAVSRASCTAASTRSVAPTRSRAAVAWRSTNRRSSSKSAMGSTSSKLSGA
jgi:ABC-type sugar transport system permease subunit